MTTLTTDKLIKDAIKRVHKDIALARDDADRFYHQIQLLKLTRILVDQGNMDSVDNTCVMCVISKTYGANPPKA